MNFWMMISDVLSLILLMLSFKFGFVLNGRKDLPTLFCCKQKEIPTARQTPIMGRFCLEVTSSKGGIKVLEKS